MTSNIDGNIAYDGQTVIFRCAIQSTGTGTILTWISEDYIGPIGSGNALEFSFFHPPETTDPSPMNPDTVATLISTNNANGVVEIVSELRIRASMLFQTSNVSCRVNGRGSPNTINFRKSDANVLPIVEGNISNASLVHC